MRKISLLAAFFAVTFIAKAQDDLSGTNVVKVNPLGLIFGSANIAYEKAVTEKSSFLIAPQFGGFKFGGVKYSSFGVGAQYRFYLSGSKTAPEGFWAGPGANYVGGKVKFDDVDGDGKQEETKFSSFGGNAMIGNQWIFDSGFVIDLGAGVSYQKFTYKDEGSIFSGLKASGVLPALSFSIGYNF